MKKISVVYNENLYAWVDTITKENNKILAVIVNPQTGIILCVDIYEIQVIDLDIIL